MDRDGVTESPAGRWTRPEDYLGSLARKRSYRRAHERRERTEPDAPRLLLSTVPFLVLLGFLAVLAVSIMVAAFPGFQPQHKAPAATEKQAGIASKGWFQEAQREFRQ